MNKKRRKWNFMSKRLKDYRKVFISLTLLTFISCGNIVIKNGIPHNLNNYYQGKMERKMAAAIAHNDVNAIEELARSGVDVSTVGKDDLSFLVLAFSLYKYESFCKLLELGADVNFIPVKGPDVLTSCLWSKDSRYLKKLLEYPVDVNYEEERRRRAIYVAIGPATTNENFRILLDRKDLDINIPTYPPFFDAVLSSNYDKALILLEYGADPFINEKYRKWFIEELEDSNPIIGTEILTYRDLLVKYLKENRNIQINLKYPDGQPFN